jgi:cytochrome c553
MPYTTPTRLASAALFALTLGATPAFAQTSGDPVRGKALFEDTPGASGINTLGSCTNCHASIQDRRGAVANTSAQSPVITFETAMNEFGTALGRPQMQQFTALSVEDRGAIAAYIADTPAVNAVALTFTATAINTITASQTITVTSPQAPLGTLVVSKIEIAGTGAANFGRTYECDAKTFTTAGSACSFTVYYSPKDTTTSNPVVTITMKEGSSPDILRRVTLNGSVSTTTSPPTTTAPEEDSGGGAIGWAWLAGLAAATVALGRRRRA